MRQRPRVSSGKHCAVGRCGRYGEGDDRPVGMTVVKPPAGQAICSKTKKRAWKNTLTETGRTLQANDGREVQRPGVLEKLYGVSG